jgi:hypothetical protein
MAAVATPRPRILDKARGAIRGRKRFADAFLQGIEVFAHGLDARDRDGGVGFSCHGLFFRRAANGARR